MEWVAYHRRIRFDQIMIRTMNGSGLPEDDPDRRKFRATNPQSRKIAQSNHHVIRNAASLVLKSDTGSAHQAHRGIVKSEWKRRNFNGEADTGLAQRSDAIAAAMAELDAQTGDRLSELRERSIALHRERFEKLLKQPDYCALYDFCGSS